jgi:hypothetical protein
MELSYLQGLNESLYHRAQKEGSLQSVCTSVLGFSAIATIDINIKIPFSMLH